MSKNLNNSRRNLSQIGNLGDEMKLRIQMVVALAVVAAMFSVPSAVSMGQFALVKVGPIDAPQAGPGPACPIGTACIK